ncbi:F-box domain-containing protein [Mycena kentingensis (nom. inval.)]|nr:F-box domain-containing protein [Mycena kentingensis (nom. inval.)]
MKPANAVLRRQMVDLELQLAMREEELREARRAVYEAQAEIATLQTELDAIVYHVETLPAELLSLIFRFMRYEDAHGLELPRCSPQPLLAVCRAWRQVALASSELWTHVAVNIATPRLPLPTDLSERLVAWLARAGERPLCLAIRGPSVDEAFAIDHFEPLLRRFSPQLKQLMLQNMSEEDMDAVDAWPQLSFPILEDADLHLFYREDPDSEDTLYMDRLLSDAPRLRTYKLANIDPAEEWPWPNLTHLTLRGRTWVKDCATALSQLPLLVSLTAQGHFYDSPDPVAVVHAALQELHLETESEFEVWEYMSAFTLPALRILDLGRALVPEDEENEAGTAVLAFLDRSQPPLRELALCADDFPFLAEIVSRCNLTHLTLETPSKTLVRDFFAAYRAHTEFCPALQSLSFVLRDTESFEDFDPEHAKISDFVRCAGKSIKWRRDATGASFVLRSFRVTRIQPTSFTSHMHFDSEQLRVFRELKASGMEILLDVKENGQGSIV